MSENGGTGVIVVTFESETTIKRCLESILRFAAGMEIIVVDNNSGDRTVEIVQSFGPKVSLVEAGVNLGFAKANNLGARESKSEYLVFLNPDTELLAAGSLDVLVKTLAGNPRFGLVGPLLVHPDGQVQKSVRNLPTPWRAFREYVLGQKGAYDFYLPLCRSICEVESIVGACMVMRKDIFEKAGRFDEKYFLYFEDLELCRSVGKLGLKVGFLPEVRVRHFEGVSGKSKQTMELLRASAKQFHGLLSYWIIEACIRAERVFHG